MIVQCATFYKSLNPRNTDKSVSDIRIRIRLPLESSFWISVSGCKLTILPDIQPANRIVIISAGRAGGPCFQMKNENCRRAAQKIRQNGGLHKKAVRRAAKKDGAGCRKGQPSGPLFPAAQFNVQPAGPPLMCNPPASPVCTLPARSSVQLASPRIIHVFHLATRLSSPPGPPFNVIHTYR